LCLPEMASPRIPHEPLTRLDFHQRDCSPAGCSSVAGGSRSAGRQRLFASCPCPLLPPAPLLPSLLSRMSYHDSKSPCSAGKATHGAAAELNSSPHLVESRPQPYSHRPKWPSWPTCFAPRGYPSHDVASLRARYEQVTRPDSRLPDCSLVGYPINKRLSNSSAG
jgi:hypothetical protein